MEEAEAKCPTCGSSFPAGATFCPECGYVVPVSSPAATLPEQMAAPPTPQSNVVYVQPSAAAPRESNWGPWVAVAAVVLIVGAGLVMWSGGYLGGSSSPSQPSTRVTIDNSPQMTSEKQPASVTPAGTAPAPVTPPAAVPPSAPPAAAATPPAAPPAATPKPAAPPSKSPAIDIISVTGQPLTTSASGWNYGYTLRVRNNTAADVKANFRVQFLDGQGFAVDDDVMNNLLIPANTELSFDGENMIQASLASRIRTLYATVR